MDLNEYGTFAGCITGPDGGSLPVQCPAFDYDKDDDVDIDDFNIFAGCMEGPGITYPGGCEYADLDSDVDVDLGDFSLFQQAFDTGG